MGLSLYNAAKGKITRVNLFMRYELYDVLSQWCMIYCHVAIMYDFFPLGISEL